MNKTTEQDLQLLKASQLTQEAIEDCRTVMLSYLKENAFHYSGAAREIGFPRETAYAMIRINIKPFRDVENFHLDELENKMYKFSMGKLGADDKFHAPTAKDILNRYRWKRRWLDETKEAKAQPVSSSGAVGNTKENADNLLRDYENRVQQPTTSVLLPGQGRRVQ